MRIIISPAKKMIVDTDSLPCETLPQFLPEAEILLRRLRELNDAELQALWNCNAAIAKQNVERLRRMDLHESLTSAILSGFYGLLHPFDGVTPYRLEMQAKLVVDGVQNLYAFWNNKLAKQLCDETDCILNLASKECSSVVSTHLPEGIRFLTCVLGNYGTVKSLKRERRARWRGAKWCAGWRKIRSQIRRISVVLIIWATPIRRSIPGGTSLCF